ncbi:jg6495 [Pararge aegeria aegeria]|uniref:Jg6495 protein n=1 Tax=Pararge aegeria aegeria TaxID=348720 RepID=A0A8S4SQ41_9NEOP|nr:jg6495 [Pararge aegeria aegeria]
MGNLHHKSSENRNQKNSVHARDGQAFTSQFSFSHFVGNLSGRSFASVTSSQSVYSASRPWSRISRRRWNDSTLRNPLEASKTAWPVAHKESIFLPEFPITTDLLQKDFEIIASIAKGAFGEVLKVKKLSENKEYALKVLHKGQIVSENAVRQVKEEARIQAAVGHHIFIAGAVSRWQTKKRLYIAPEVVQREPYGHAADWWSLGVLTCRMLTGETPDGELDHHGVLVSGSLITQSPVGKLKLRGVLVSGSPT